MPENQRLIHLDMLRGIAALIVVVGHIRGFLLVDYGQAGQPSVLALPVYLQGGMGHQAVIAFFALSGFLVGGATLRNISAGSWSFPNYLIVRLARLWTVVIPALILTLLLDVLGGIFGGEAGYAGLYFGLLSSGPSIENPLDHSFKALIGNVAFLQTIVTPVYGSNGPLWSLAYEFWYYVMIPLGMFAFLSPSSPPMRVVALATALLIATIIPFQITILGLIWLAGAMAARMMSIPEMIRVFKTPWYALGAVGTVMMLVAAGFRYKGTGFDLVLGLAWAATLPALALVRDLGHQYRRLAHALSEISYTLYATHFPLLALLYFCAIAPHQWPPGPAMFTIGAVMLCASLLLAWAMWWCFERNTVAVRNAALRFLGRGKKISSA